MLVHGERELRPEQQLDRLLKGFNDVALGFAVISRAIRLYAGVLVGPVVALAP